MTASALRAQLVRHEGYRQRPYRCTAGYLTVGIGRNIEERPFSDAVIDLMFQEDVAAIVGELSRAWPPFTRLDEVRQRALIDMGFMGVPRLLGFRRMLHALAAALAASTPEQAAEHYEEAAAEALQSRWASQVQPERSKTVAFQLRTGRDPE